jgi:hypothetical protein
VCFFSNDDYHLWSEDFVQKTRVFEMISEKCVSVEKPLWAVKNDWDGGKPTDGRIEFSLDTDYRSCGHHIIIEVVEDEDQQSAKIVESKQSAGKVCVEWRISKILFQVSFRFFSSTQRSYSFFYKYWIEWSKQCTRACGERRH